MLTVSKKPILFFRVLMWGGLVLVGIGAIFYYISSETYIDIILPLTVGGFAISIIGSLLMRRLFRCPNCKKSVLGTDSGIDKRTSNCPDHCPHCGAPVQVK